mmetsp:Transcript_51/g.143  ORF Transcript_51/g.143 Transcript_51/m.143 type:complete len:255 (+) Transcript_51:1089-1853(+)
MPMRSCSRGGRRSEASSRCRVPRSALPTTQSCGRWARSASTRSASCVSTNSRGSSRSSTRGWAIGSARSSPRWPTRSCSSSGSPGSAARRRRPPRSAASSACSSRSRAARTASTLAARARPTCARSTPQTHKPSSWRPADSPRQSATSPRCYARRRPSQRLASCQKARRSPPCSTWPTATRQFFQSPTCSTRHAPSYPRRSRGTGRPLGPMRPATRAFARAATSPSSSSRSRLASRSPRTSWRTRPERRNRAQR